MVNNKYIFGDPRKLFERWKELTGEDLTIDTKVENNTIKAKTPRST